MQETEPDLNERYARGVLAAMLYSPNDYDGFDRDIAAEIADERIEDVEMNYIPQRNGDITVAAKVTGGSLNGSNPCLELYNFTVATMNAATVTDDGTMRVEFIGFRSPNAVTLQENDRGLLESRGATKYTFIVDVEP